MNARVENRLGTAPWLLVIDTDSLACDAVEGPARSAGPGAGIQAVTLVLGLGARALLTGTISPGIADTLRKNGIEVITGVDGSVQDTLFGAMAGSLMAGNPINSYVMGAVLIEMGVSLLGAVAFMLAWVNIGLIQLPAEIAALGAVFAGLRNLAVFIMVILVAVLTVVLMGLGL